MNVEMGDSSQTTAIRVLFEDMSSINDENHSPQISRMPLRDALDKDPIKTCTSPPRTPPMMKSTKILQTRAVSPSPTMSLSPIPIKPSNLTPPIATSVPLRPLSPQPLTSKPLSATTTIPLARPATIRPVLVSNNITVTASNPIAKPASSETTITSPQRVPTTHTTITLHSVTLLTSAPILSITVAYNATTYTTTAMKTASSVYTPIATTFSFITAANAKLKLHLITAQDTLEVSIATTTRLTTIPLLQNDNVIGSIKFALSNLQEDYFDDSASDTSAVTTPTSTVFSPATTPLSPMIMRSPYPRTPLATPRVRRYIATSSTSTTSSVATQTDDIPPAANTRPSIFFIFALLLLIIGSLKYIYATMPPMTISANVSNDLATLPSTTFCPPCPDVCAEEEAMEEINEEIIVF